MAKEPTGRATNREIISSQLVRISAELREIELVANASLVDPNILADFRSAVDHARSIAWAVQQRLQAPGEGLDVLPILVKERIRRVIELCEVLTRDLSSPQAKQDCAARDLLHQTARRLCDHLEKLPR
jgi:hypothetical protein